MQSINALNLIHKLYTIGPKWQVNLTPHTSYTIFSNTDYASHGVTSSPQRLSRREIPQEPSSDKQCASPNHIQVVNSPGYTQPFSLPEMRLFALTRPQYSQFQRKETQHTLPFPKSRYSNLLVTSLFYLYGRLFNPRSLDNPATRNKPQSLNARLAQEQHVER